jgi:hypothetical protein
MKQIAASTQATAARLETMHAVLSTSLEVQKSCVQSQKASTAAQNAMQAVLSTSLEVQKSCVQSQKASTTAQQASTAAQKAMQARLDSMESSLSASLQAQKAMQAKLEALEGAAVQQTLLSAWDHSTVGEFEFSTGDGPVKSGVVVKEVLEAFMQDCGAWMHDTIYIDTSDEAGRAKFRDKFSNQIHILTGVKPRLEEELNSEKKKQWAIKRK